ncbi:MAG: arginine deiminase-related protein [Pseudomonadota bacterium]
MSSPAENPQSTNHIMVMEPIDFHANPQTMATNSYQHEDDKDIQEIQNKAREEFRTFRDLLVSHGVIVTTTLGQKGCPDDIFCNNWVSTHSGGRMVLYPMLAPNRQIERRPELIDFLKGRYDDVIDLVSYESEGKALESTGAICLDRVNKIAYQNLSKRSDLELGKIWCDKNDFTHYPFETEYKGKPVYHADVVMWIGTELAGICSDNLVSRDIIDSLKEKRDVIEFTTTQMENFCGNSLEVVGTDNERMLVMSAAGYSSLRDDQKEQLDKYYKKIIIPDIQTIEYYGGGSARCMLLEMF